MLAVFSAIALLINVRVSSTLNFERLAKSAEPFKLNGRGGLLLEYDSKKLLHENEEKKHVSKSYIFQKLLL